MRGAAFYSVSPGSPESTGAAAGREPPWEPPQLAPPGVPPYPARLGSMDSGGAPWRYSAAGRDSVDSDLPAGGAGFRHQPPLDVAPPAEPSPAPAAPPGRWHPDAPPGLGSPASTAVSGAAASGTTTPVVTDGADASSRQLWSPSKRPQAAFGQHPQQQQPYTGFYGSGGPRQQPSLYMEPAAYPTAAERAAHLAGERAAFLHALKQSLPGQQALGQLFSAVDALHSRLEEEAAQWRQLQAGAARTGGLLESLAQRLDGLEYQQLPQLQQRAEELAARPSDQLVQVLGSLRQALGELAQQRQQLADTAYAAAQRGGSPGLMPRQLHWLLLAAAGYGQCLLSKADVAALFLSRKILLVPAPGDQGAPQPGGQLRTALSVLLFVASVEAAWQAQQRVLGALPSFAQRMAAPLHLGLRVARTAVWSAALVLAAAQARASCQDASSSVCAALAAVADQASSAPLPTWAHAWAFPLWQRRLPCPGPAAASSGADSNTGCAPSSCCTAADLQPVSDRVAGPGATDVEGGRAPHI